MAEPTTENQSLLEAAVRRLEMIERALAQNADPAEAARMRAMGADVERSNAALSAARDAVLREFPQAAGRRPDPLPAQASQAGGSAAVPAFQFTPPPSVVSSAAATGAAAGAAAATTQAVAGPAAAAAQRAAPPPRPLPPQGAVSGISAASSMMAATQAVAGMGGGVMSLASSADPFSAFPTFTASMKGLAVEAGSSLLPALNEISAKIQELEKFIEGLDPVLKESIGKWVLWGTAGAGAVLVAGRIGQALMSVAAAAKAVGVAMLTTPWGLVAAGAAAVGALAYAWLQAGDNAQRAGRFFGLAGERAGEVENPDAVKADQFAKVPAAFRERLVAAGSDQAKVAKVLDEFEAAAKQKLAQAQAEQVPQASRQERLRARFDELTKEEMPAVSRMYLDATTKLDPDMDRATKASRLREISDNATRRAAFRVHQQLFREGLTDDASTEGTHEAMSRRLSKKFLPEKQFTDTFQGAPEMSKLGVLLFNAGVLNPPKPPEARAGAREEKARLDELKALRAEVTLAEDLKRKSGAGGMLTDFKGPPASILSDPSQLMDRVQLAALNVGDKSAANMEKQLRNAEKSNELLTNIFGELNRLNQNVQPRHR